MDSRTARFPLYTVFCVCISCLGSFSLGWTVGSPNITGAATHTCAEADPHSAMKWLPDCLPMDNLLWGFAVSSFCIGALIASLWSSPLLTRLGRKKTIALNNLGWIVGSILMGFAVSPVMFIVGRICCGLSCGLGSVATPTYNGEIATIRGRGAMGTLNQLYIVVGILIANLVGLFLASAPYWRLSHALVLVPALLQLALLPFCPESPRYLVSKRRIDDAKSSLQRLRGNNYSVDDELQDIITGQLGGSIQLTNDPEKHMTNSMTETEMDLSQTFSKGETNSVKTSLQTIQHDIQETCTIRQLFQDPLLRRITLIVIMLHLSQQFSGINGVMYYSTTIFEAAFDKTTSMYMAIVTSAINLVVTVISMTMIDRLGRRVLLTIATVGGCVTAITLTLGGYYNLQKLLVGSVFMFVASFAIGLGPIPWMITSELAPTRAASGIGAIATAINWGSNFCIGLIFPTLMSRLQSFAFLIFAGILFISTVLMILYVPETKGRSIEEIQTTIEASVNKKEAKAHP